MIKQFFDPLKTGVLSFIYGLIICCYTVLPAVSQEKLPTSYLKYIDPTIGNIGQLLEPTRPTVQLPNQMIRMAPIRADYRDDQISSFPLNIVSHRLGQVFSVKPSIKAVATANWNQKMAYDHDLEVTRPWYYSTYLIEDEVTVQFVPGQKTGLFRFQFPASGQKNILLGTYNNGNPNTNAPAEWNFLNGNEVEGLETYHGDIKVYVYGMFSEKGNPGVVEGQTVSDGKVSVKGDKGARSWISFPAAKSNTIELRYAISYVSLAQARKNFAEIKAQTFQAALTKGEMAWEKVIGQIKVTGGTEAQKRTFYTALYRTYERMVNISEDGMYYSGFDKTIHTDNRPFYVDDWTWDTYLAHHPLRMILNPKQEEDMLHSFVRMYDQSGWMPTFPVLFGDHACMNGFHSSIVFLDAHRKGLKNFDIEKAYSGMLKNANEATMIPWRNGAKTVLDDFYHAKGYFPAIPEGAPEPVTTVDGFEKRQSVAVTLGHAYDDWALGQLAKDMGKTADFQKFNARGQNYKTLWDSETKFFMPKDDKGNWIKIDPVFDGGMGGRQFYDENNGWTYMWQVQHDIPGLISLMGGKSAFESRLDQLFREPLGSPRNRSRYEFWAKFPDATALVGQFSMGNEPSFHIPYLYNYTAPWKTQKQIRLLLDLWFKDNVFGIPGDEDGGGMTAFVVFSSMGFYPVTPGSPMYTIGSPVFSNVTIDLQNGKKFNLAAAGASRVNKYIQSAKFNGVKLNTPWFSHEQLMAGGKLELVMGPKPNKSWGVTP